MKASGFVPAALHRATGGLSPVGRRRGLWLLGLVLFAVVVAIAVERGNHQRPGTDFYVFWRAGYAFAHDLPLYGGTDGTRQLLYPPFAAQVFQLLAVFPLRIAAGLFYLASVGLWAVAIGLTREIIRKLAPGAPAPALALWMAVVLSGQFVLNNLNLLQVNLVIFVLCLLGVRGIVDGRPQAVGWLVGAAALKITPIFFVAWAIIRGGRRALVMAVLAAAACLALPILQRGPEAGIADLAAYYVAFLGQFASGAVVTDYTNQNLAAMVYRAIVVPPTPQQYSYYYLPSLQSAAPTLYRVLAGLVMAGFLTRLVWLARRRRPIAALEVAGVFLVSHLLSGITWKAHLVTMLFVFYAFFVVDRRRLGRAQRIALGTAWVGIAFIGLTGRDLLGNTVHHYMGGYSAYVWLMLFLLALTVWLDPGPMAPSAAQA